MANFDLMRRLALPKGGKIVLLVMDGVGGINLEPGGQTTLEAAETPNMDLLASDGTLGLIHPISYGVTPGSGPAHLALFGYDPIAVDVGRGVLSALGVGIDLAPDDVAARGNFCTIDGDGNISDRRAGRISTEEALPRIEKLRQIEIDGVEIDVRPVKEYRFVLHLRGDGLSGALADTDPQQTGVPPLDVAPQAPAARETARLVQAWVDKAKVVLDDDHPANMLTLRGFAQDPQLPTFEQIYKLNAACVATYPMYKGVSRLVGMDVLPADSSMTPEEEFQVVADHWDQYDFFFVHIKPTDSRGEDGDFEAKKQVIETVDQALPTLLNLEPDVLIITGDHSTPAKMRSHSWHPVPTLLYAPETQLQDRARHFGEREAQERGGLGQFPSKELMSLALAHAKRLAKFGA